MHALGWFGFERLKRALPGRRSEHMHALGPFGFERPARRSPPSAGASTRTPSARSPPLEPSSTRAPPAPTTARERQSYTQRRPSLIKSNQGQSRPIKSTQGHSRLLQATQRPLRGHSEANQGHSPVPRLRAHGVRLESRVTKLSRSPQQTSRAAPSPGTVPDEGRHQQPLRADPSSSGPISSPIGPTRRQMQSSAIIRNHPQSAAVHSPIGPTRRRRAAAT